MDRIIGFFALATSIAALVPLFFDKATANVNKRRILSSIVIIMLLLLVGNYFWTKHIEEKAAQEEASEQREKIKMIKRDIVQQLKKSPMTFDQMSSSTNEYNFNDKNEAIDELKNEGQIDSDIVRLRQDAQGNYMAKVWYLIEGKKTP
jgi:hypothetical protein